MGCEGSETRKEMVVAMSLLWLLERGLQGEVTTG